MTTKLSSETAPQQTLLEQAARQIIVDWDSGIHLYEAIAALRKALAEQAEQEPVATVKRNEDDSLTFTPLRDFYVVNGMELYAASVRTKDLTDDEIVHLVNSVWFLDELMVAKVNFARAVIAADREKNK